MNNTPLEYRQKQKKTRENLWHLTYLQFHHDT
jgi:hypothetical protein